jgi:hypothetical protein
MSKVYVVTVGKEWTIVCGVFDNPLAAVLAVSNRSCSGDVTISRCEVGSVYDAHEIFYSEATVLRDSFDRVFEGRFDVPHYFPAVKERYKTAEELFEARRNNHAMMNDVLRGFSAIMKGLFSDEEIVAMYEGGEG